MKFFRTNGVVLFVVLVSFFLIHPSKGIAQSKNSSALKELLQKRDKEIKDLMGPKGTDYNQKQKDQLKDIINGIIDYRSMAKYALQDTFDTLSSDQQKEFVDLFSTIIRDQSLKKLDIYRAKVTYNEINVDKDSAVVKTNAQLEKVRTPVTYKMYYDEKGKQWVVTDMIIDDVSTAESYRRQFQNIIRKRGYDGLLEILRKRAGR